MIDQQEVGKRLEGIRADLFCLVERLSYRTHLRPGEVRELSRDLLESIGDVVALRREVAPRQSDKTIDRIVEMNSGGERPRRHSPAGDSLSL